LFQKWLREININNIDHRVSQNKFEYEDELIFPKIDVNIEDIENIKSILLIDSNITYEQPILSHKIRKAYLKNAKINSIHSYNYNYNFDINNSFLVNPNQLVETLIDIIEYLTVITINDKSLKKFIVPDGIKKKFKGLSNKKIIEISNDILTNDSLIILGSNLKNHPDYSFFKILVNIISTLTKSNKAYLGNNSNEAGAYLTGCLPNKSEGLRGIKNNGLNVYDSIIKNMECYIIYNLELIDFYYYPELKNSLEKAKFVLGFQNFVTEEEKNYYDVILPLATIFESPGTFINIEGQWQSFVQACKPHHNSKEGWKILTKLRSVFGANIENSLDYIDILNEVDSSIRNNKSFESYEYTNIDIKNNSHNGSLIRSGGSSNYFVDNVVRRATSLNNVNISKNSISVNRRTLEQNNIDVSKNKVLVKQGENSLLAELIIDENVSDDCVYIVNSNKEHYDLGKQYEPIIIENV